MIHKKCSGKIVLDCTSMYLIQSPSINIYTRVISPGVVQIDSNKTKGCAKLICSTCQESFSNKNEFEEGILDSCSICGNNYPPSELQVTEYASVICIHCIEKAKTSKFEDNKIQDKMLYLYGEILKKGDNPTLLTILMKK